MMLRLVQKTPAWVIWAFVILMTLLGVVAFVDANSDNREQDSRISQQRDTLTDQEQELEAMADAVAEANRRLASVGVPPVPVPTSTATPTTPPIVIREPSAAELDAAVRRYCAGGACRGRGVTTSQVRSALAVYCAARSGCRGPAGATGGTGSTGSNGEPGPGPTTEQVAAAVAEYCGSPSGPCRGRGIAALACSTGLPHGLTIQVTYSDGTSDTIECTSGGDATRRK